MTSQELSSRLAADRLGGGEEALLQASLVEHFEQVLSETIARRTLEGQQLDDGLAGGPDSSSGPLAKLVARGGRMVVGWGRWGRAIAQTPVLRAGVP